MRLASLMLDGGDVDYDALPSPALRASPPLSPPRAPRPAPLQTPARAKPTASAATPTVTKSVPPLPPTTIRPAPSIDQRGSPLPSTINTLTRTEGPPSNSPYVAPRKYKIFTIVDLSIARSVRAGVMLRHVCHRVDSILKYHAPYSTFKFGLTSNETMRWDFYLRADSFSNMYILARMGTLEGASMLEATLIKLYGALRGSRHLDTNDLGGEGPPTVSDSYATYMVHADVRERVPKCRRIA